MLKKALLIFISILLISFMASCNNGSGENEDGEKKVVLACKPMTEQYILGEILAALIEQNSDIKVEKNFGIGGGTSNIHPAMVKGEIDIYPEYTGTGWLTVLKKEPIKDSDTLFKSVADSYANEYSIHWSERYGFNNTYALVIRKDTAEKYHIKTFEDLAKASDKLVIGANPDFFEREDTFKGLNKVYDFHFKEKKEMDISLRYEALSSEDIDVTTAFNTDPKVKEYDLVLLEDNKKYFQSYHAATLVRLEVLEKYPALKEILAKLDNNISDEEMLQMNYRVEILKEDPKKVALEFIKKKELELRIDKAEKCYEKI